MVKSVLGVKHQGLRDWVVQRVTALIAAIYSLGLLFYFVCHPGLSFAEWHYAFSLEWVKVATLLFVLSILAHAWVGIWTVFTDYVHPWSLRCFLNLMVFLFLIACFFWGVLILWSV